MYMGMKPVSEHASEYAEARATLMGIEPLRGTDIRPLGRRASANPRSVREGPDGEIIFKLYDTDVITWSRDGTCVLETWGSKSTVEFANSFLPARVQTFSECRALYVEGRNYKLSGSLVRIKPTPSGGYELDTRPGESQPMGTEPIQSRTVNRKEAAKLYAEHNLKQFVAFFDAVTAMRSPAVNRTGPIRRPGVLEALRSGDPGRWRDLADALRGMASPAAILRRAVCEEYDAFHYHSAEFVTEYDGITRADATMRTKTDFL